MQFSEVPKISHRPQTPCGCDIRHSLNFCGFTSFLVIILLNTAHNWLWLGSIHQCVPYLMPGASKVSCWLHLSVLRTALPTANACTAKNALVGGALMFIAKVARLATLGGNIRSTMVACKSWVMLITLFTYKRQSHKGLHPPAIRPFWLPDSCNLLLCVRACKCELAFLFLHSTNQSIVINQSYEGNVTTKLGIVLKRFSNQFGAHALSAGLS